MAAAQDYISYLMKQGNMSQTAATAAVARFIQESSLQSSAVGDKSIPGGSVGLGQWNRDRKQGLLDFAGADWQNPYKQLDYFVHEGQGKEAGAYSALLAAKTPEQATNAMMGYERPQGWSAANPQAGSGYGNTLRNYYDLAGGGAGPTTSVAQRPNASSPQMATDMASPGNNAVATPRPTGQMQGPSTPPGWTPPAAPGRDQLASDMMKNMTKGITGSGMFGAGGGQSLLPGMDMPKAARIDTPDVANVDPNQIANQRQNLAMAMQRLNSGKVWG